MTDREQFTTKVEPIMDRVMQDLRSRQAEETRRFMRSPAYILSGISGPDGGMASQAIALDSLRVTGEWNSKTAEDYVEMVKAELRKEGITVTPQIEEMMIEKMARDQVPQSSIDYILRKAAGNSIFGLPEEARKTPLQREIEERAEEMYNPTKVEKGIGWGLGAAADFATMGGLGGGVVSGIKFVGADLAINAVIDTVDASQRKDVPKVIAPGHEEEWLAMNGGKQEETEPVQKEPAIQEQPPVEQMEPEPQAVPASEETAKKEVAQAPVQETKETAPEQQAVPEKSNTGGWQGLLTGLGLNGIGDIGRNAGYILAMLPDILLGMFTGKTQSLGIKDNLVPIASIMAGLFVKNPLLKMTLIGLGGANLINKAGHEQLAKRDGVTADPVRQNRYLQYEDQKMNPRIRDAQIQGNTLIASIDGIPVTVTLPDKVMEAHAVGALPLGTLANAVLEKCDRMQEVSEARDRFEEESRSQTRGITQREQTIKTTVICQREHNQSRMLLTAGGSSSRRPSTEPPLAASFSMRRARWPRDSSSPPQGHPSPPSMPSRSPSTATVADSRPICTPLFQRPRSAETTCRQERKAFLSYGTGGMSSVTVPIRKGPSHARNTTPFPTRRRRDTLPSVTARSARFSISSRRRFLYPIKKPSRRP